MLRTVKVKNTFLSTLSLRRATCFRVPYRLKVAISIHALLAESDGVPLFYNNRCQDFYPRSPCGERPNIFGGVYLCIAYFYPRSPCGERLNGVGLIVHIGGFLSTLSLRRATGKVRVVEPGLAFLSTLSLRRATAVTTVVVGPSRDFYPRSPCGERPGTSESRYKRTSISIHALLAESDHYDNYNLHCVEISIHALLAESD